jgi:uncharacterized protein
MKTHFLRAEWNNLILANYAVPKELLLPYLPNKTELSSFEGKTFVSLVGFMFLNTKVWGLSIPMHSDFEEVNLRFYVKYNDHGEWKRGVVFIKEIVPKKAISFIANFLYGENYTTMNMKHSLTGSGENIEVGYEWNYKNTWNKISVIAGKRSRPIITGSRESFFADHYWGYSKYNDTKTFEYEVAHKPWETLNVLSYTIVCDFGFLYGNNFSFLNDVSPDSVLLTRGSDIKVYPKRQL